MNSKKPNEFARDLFNNCLYFTGGKMMARECALFICQKFIDYCSRMDDKVYHLEVQEELYKIDITNS
jgi:hypothetical protein